MCIGRQNNVSEEHIIFTANTSSSSKVYNNGFKELSGERKSLKLCIYKFSLNMSTVGETDVL